MDYESLKQLVLTALEKQEAYVSVSKKLREVAEARAAAEYDMKASQEKLREAVIAIKGPEALHCVLLDGKTYLVEVREDLGPRFVREVTVSKPKGT